MSKKENAKGNNNNIWERGRCSCGTPGKKSDDEIPFTLSLSWLSAIRVPWDNF